jgi:hypothetical protein
MANLILNGSTSGSVTLSSPAVSGTTTLTLPTTSGTVVTTATGQTLTSPVIAGTPTGVGVLTAATAQATTSGTSKDFTGIPSWVKRITVMLQSVSTNGTSSLQIQIGSGSIANTGYDAGVWSANTTNANNTAGFTIAGVVAAGSYSGICTLTLLNSATNLWVESGAIGQSVAPSSNGGAMVSGGNKTLSGVLDQVRITTVNGTDTFDAGSVNILYE